MEAFDDFTIDKKSDIPVWVQLKQRISYRILSGHYEPGDKLPTVRDLSIQYNVHYHTVNKVYRDLEAKGLVDIIPGRGTFVADLSNSRFHFIENDVEATISEFSSKLLKLGITPVEAVQSFARHLNVPITINAASTADPAQTAPTEEKTRRVG